MKKRNFAKAMLVVACSASLAACSSSGNNETSEATTAAETTTEAETTTAAETTEAETEAPSGPMELKIGQVEGAAHGDKCFTVATAVVDANDTIIAAYIDEFQFLDAEQEGVPNSEAFVTAGSVAEGQVLGSKRKNDNYYSEMMEKSGATMMISSNFDEIQAFAAGKTIAELEELAGKSSEEVLDAVSSATLVDTPGYLGVIADAAKAAKENESVVYEGDRDNLLLNMDTFAAHGDKCFTVAASLNDGETVILSYIDEFQFLDGEQEGVPNSDAFTEAGSILDGKVLGSKRVNNTYYSENMKNAGATMEIAANFDAIQEFVNGKTLMELEELVAANYVSEEEETEAAADEGGADDRTAMEESEGEEADAISGATLADKWGYVAAILNSIG